jgi:hypothetical protein
MHHTGIWKEREKGKGSTFKQHHFHDVVLELFVYRD